MQAWLKIILTTKARKVRKILQPRDYTRFAQEKLPRRHERTKHEKGD